jgi:hypothetical protein
MTHRKNRFRGLVKCVAQTVQFNYSNDTEREQNCKALVKHKKGYLMHKYHHNQTFRYDIPMSINC